MEHGVLCVRLGCFLLGVDGSIEMSALFQESPFFCLVVGGFQTQEQVMASAGASEDSSAGFGQSGQSFYNSRAVPRGGPRNPRMMNGYRGSSNGFRGTTHKEGSWPHETFRSKCAV